VLALEIFENLCALRCILEQFLAPKSVYFNKSLLKTHSLQDEFL